MYIKSYRFLSASLKEKREKIESEQEKAAISYHRCFFLGAVIIVVDNILSPHIIGVTSLGKTELHLRRYLVS